MSNSYDLYYPDNSLIDLDDFQTILDYYEIDDSTYKQNIENSDWISELIERYLDDMAMGDALYL